MSFYIIEKTEQLSRLNNLGDCFVDFIPFNNFFHRNITSISLIFIRPLNKHKGYMLCIEHTESLKLNWELIQNFLLLKVNRIFVLNKKEILYNITDQNIFDKIYDISFLQNINTNDISNFCIAHYYNKYPNLQNINNLIPISKHYEQKEEIFKKLKPIIKNSYGNENSNIYKFNNDETIRAYYKIESQGIKIDKIKFNIFFPRIIQDLNIKDNKIYTQYNLHTLTGRVSNNFNGINFLALNKENGERECFIPSNNMFIEFDINGYHPRLLGKLVKYELPKENLYGNLGIEKEEMFQNIYGGIRKDHPFLNAIKKFVEYTWQVNKYGINTQNKCFDWERDGIDSEYKMLNYLVQSYETYENVQIINKITEFLKYKKTKIVLCSYDAFLLDFSREDGEEILEEIEKIIEYPVKIKRGKDYGNLY